MQHIETVTVGSGGAASITFSAIPADYTDLVIVTSLRSARANAIDGLLISFNGSSSNFTARILLGYSTAALSDSYTVGRAAIISGASSTASTFGSQSFYIPNYAGSANKSYSVDSVSENNSGASFAATQEITAGLWSQTAAITSITLTSDTASNLAEFSSASLYGITAGSDGIVAVS